MKKILATILAAVASGAVLADQGSILATFSTKGPDCYADGTVVKDGECYALVWTLTNAVFRGISVDGKAVGSQDDNRVLCIAPLAKGGRCPDVVVEVPAVLADRYAGAGTFSLHLLDTRRADGTPGGVSAGVNGYGAAESFKLSASEQLQGAAAGSDLKGVARDLAFTAIWTLKESYVKAVGRGLQIPLNSFEVKMPFENDSASAR